MNYQNFLEIWSVSMYIRKIQKNPSATATIGIIILDSYGMSTNKDHSCCHQKQNHQQTSLSWLNTYHKHLPIGYGLDMHQSSEVCHLHYSKNILGAFVRPYIAPRTLRSSPGSAPIAWAISGIALVNSCHCIGTRSWLIRAPLCASQEHRSSVGKDFF